MMKLLFKLLYRLGLRKDYTRIDRLRYLKRLRKKLSLVCSQHSKMTPQNPRSYTNSPMKFPTGRGPAQSAATAGNLMLRPWSKIRTRSSVCFIHYN